MMAWGGRSGLRGPAAGADADRGDVRRPRRLAPSSTRLGRRVAIACTLLCGLALVFTHTLRASVGDPDLYQSALVRTDAYDRIYRDVLVDPVVSARLQPMVADLPSAGPAIADNLRTLVPPATVRQIVEPIVQQLVRYVRGEVTDPTVTVELQPIVDAVHAVAEQYLPSDDGQVWSVVAATGREFRPLLEQVLSEALRGEMVSAPLDVTTGPPRVGGLADVAVAFVPPDQRARLRPLVEDRLLDGDVTGALAVVLPAARDAAEQALADAAPHQLDGAPEVRVPADEVRNSAVGQFVSRLRVMVGTTAAAERPLWLLLTLSGAAALAATAALRRDPFRLSGLLLGSVGAGWLLAVVSLRAFMPRDGGAFSGNLPGLPPSVARLLGDLGTQLLRGFTHRLAQTAWACLLAGLVITAMAFVVPTAWRWARTPWRVVAPTGALVLMSAGLVHLPLWPWEAAAGERQCNGSAELCNRPYDQVVQAASHNAMAAADYRFFAPHQDLSITGQLELGVRALLIDTHYWEPPSEVDDYVSRLPEPLAARTRSLLSPQLTPRPGTWLCHRLCAFGALDLVTGLEEVAKFLGSHPDEVVTLDVEDHISPADTEAALRAAGLFDRLFTPPLPGGNWPTLGQMIASGRNLVIFAESAHDPTRPWYANFFDHVMDTPYDAPSRGELSCDVNRGGTSSSMFLVNHWVSSDAAGRDEAAAVNNADVIVERAERCAAERGARVTMVAVDFADIGDVVGAVARLNREAALQPCAARAGSSCPPLSELAVSDARQKAQQPARGGPPGGHP